MAVIEHCSWIVHWLEDVVYVLSICSYRINMELFTTLKCIYSNI